MASKELKEERRAQGLCVYCGRIAGFALTQTTGIILGVAPHFQQWP